jgi:hypothetical protein
MSKALQVPPEVARDENSTELLRAWAANGGLVCVLKPAPWNGAPEHWGIVLADVARHVANAVREERGVPAHATLAIIAHIFNSELKAPTDSPFGHFAES